MRAIDVYSGIGGWSLGLKMAGINVIQSYERWDLANQTNTANNGHPTTQVDIRSLELSSLPKDIDIVVGSPPCTEFSFSNRGGNGNLKDGFKDIIKFFEIVDYLKPKYWAMENVPRTAKIIEAELKYGGSLYRFKHLKIKVDVLKFEEYGLPQKRRRCIAGNFDLDLLKTYGRTLNQRTLGDVVKLLSGKRPIDPIYGASMPADSLRDHILEDFLTEEEVRINRASKTCHPIYNAMQFPDLIDRPARTITATSTRVSRESVIIADSSVAGRYRRLTIRESASGQGFPASFQFLGKTYAQKIKMIGNAMPPLIAFYVAQSMLGTAAESLIGPEVAIRRFTPSSAPTSECRMDRAGATFNKSRRFRFAIPYLRLGSGVRFELTNRFERSEPRWEVGLLFGTSTDILKKRLDAALLEKATKQIPQNLVEIVQAELLLLQEKITKCGNANELQSRWIRSSREEHHPFELLDTLDFAADKIARHLKNSSAECEAAVRALIRGRSNQRRAKLCRHSVLVFAGILIGSLANVVFEYTDAVPKRGDRALFAKAAKRSGSDASRARAIAA